MCVASCALLPLCQSRADFEGEVPSIFFQLPTELKDLLEDEGADDLEDLCAEFANLNPQARGLVPSQNKRKFGITMPCQKTAGEHTASGSIATTLLISDASLCELLCR